MPIYEYECSKCGKTFEVIQKMSDRPLKKHESCGGSLTKLISAAGFQFKGTGWYVTDYARKGAAGESKDSTEAKDGKDTKDVTAKDTSSNGDKEGSSGKAGAQKAGKKDSHSKSGKKD
jgi:putative FmdB family regulatory protein